MFSHSRIHKTIPWLGAAFTLLLFTAWIGSGYRGLSFATPQSSSPWWVASIWGGQLHIIRNFGVLDGGPPDGFGWHHAMQFELYHDFRCSRVYGDLHIAIPLWAPTILSFLLTLAAFGFGSRRRRETTNHCPKCDYDRAGLPTSAPCPECGTAPPR